MQKWLIFHKTPTTPLTTKLDVMVNRLNGHSLSIDVLKSKLSENNSQQRHILLC